LIGDSILTKYTCCLFSHGTNRNPSGGALTSVLLDTLHALAGKDGKEKPNKMDFLLGLRTRMVGLPDEISQRPQFCSSVKDDMNQDFELVPSSCTGNKRAVIVGINYVGTENPLAGCQHDAINMQNYLLDVEGFEEENITMIMDDGKATRPTKLNIMFALYDMVKASEAGDFCFFHYSGHGSFVEDHTGDEKDGFDELLSTVDGDITDDELRDHIVFKLKKDVTMFCIFDCCMSGTVMDLPYRFEFTADTMEDVTNERDTKPEEEEDDELAVVLNSMIAEQVAKQIAEVGGPSLMKVKPEEVDTEVGEVYC
jgi:metacaspase-1